MTVVENTSNSIIVDKSDREYPEEIKHNGIEYIYGTYTDSGVIYFKKEWLYS